MERPLSLNLDSLPVNIMSESARKKYTEVFTKQNHIAENGKSMVHNIDESNTSDGSWVGVSRGLKSPFYKIGVKMSK